SSPPAPPPGSTLFPYTTLFRSVESVAYTYAGVRPLSYEEGKRESDVSRAHKVVTEAGGRFLSITGTKLTCFRSLAAQLGDRQERSEEHTSELQSRFDLVCRLLL